MSRVKKNQKKIVENRIIKLMFTFLLIFSLLVVRLYYLQIESHDNLKSEALQQRSKQVSLYPNRGVIYDMNMIPLTNANRENTLFITKNSLIDDSEIHNYVLNITGMNENELEEYIDSKDDILALPLKYNIENIEDEKNMIVTERTLRYSDNNLLSHVIGYINESENRGESGIEKVFNEYLTNQTNTSSLYIELDKNNGILIGGEHNVSNEQNSLEPSGVKLTVDYHIQKIVENILDKEEVNGGVVISDVESGEIRAMASRPNFGIDNVEEYLHRDDMALYNKTIQVGYPPGSLFKIVVLLTVLEEQPHLINENFYCKGYEEIGNLTINCNNTFGHGLIDFREGFSKSCNSVFIQLGRLVGSESIINMARRLGFGEKINIGLLEEIPGNLPEGDELQGPAIGNIAIGQGSIEVTPLQMTNLIMILANGGVEKGLTIVDSITSQNGSVIKKYNREEERILSEEVCKKAQKYLELVVEEGTASNLNVESIGGAAGKTGTAQGVFNRQETIYGWFAGYYPKDNPKYAITILVEDADSGSQSAVSIFEKIVKEIYKINR